MKMNYIVRRKEDDKYFSIKEGDWKDMIDDSCYLSKFHVDDFKKSHEKQLNDYLIYLLYQYLVNLFLRLLNLYLLLFQTLTLFHLQN